MVWRAVTVAVLCNPRSLPGSGSAKRLPSQTASSRADDCNGDAAQANEVVSGVDPRPAGTLSDVFGPDGVDPVVRHLDLGFDGGVLLEEVEQVSAVDELEWLPVGELV